METSYHITSFIREQLAQNPPKLSFSAADQEAWQAWKRDLSGKLYELLGPWPAPAVDRARIVAITDAGSHWREDVEISSTGHPTISGYLLRPKDVVGKSPAIMALHGHGPGKAEVVGLNSSGYALQPYGLQMVEAGYVVFSFDYFPFGTRKETDHNAFDGFEYACNSTLIRTLLLGFNLLTMNLFDVLRSCDYLCSRPEVDPQRIGVMGSSYGGTTSMYAGILDPRFKAVALSCSLGEYRGHGIELDQLCGVQVVPGVLQWAEMGDVAGLLAPRPLFVESARGDDCFPWKHTEPVLARLREVYEVAGAVDRLQINVHDGGHQYYGDGIHAFWGRYL